MNLSHAAVTRVAEVEGDSEGFAAATQPGRAGQRGAVRVKPLIFKSATERCILTSIL